MIINKLYINGYKNLNNIKIENPTDCNTLFLIGENGFGKTNIIETIILILDSLQKKIIRSKDAYYKLPFEYELEYIVSNKQIRLFNSSVYLNDKKMTMNELTQKMIPNTLILYSAGDSKRIYELIENTKLKNHIEILNLEYDVQKQICLDFFNREKAEDLHLNKLIFHFQPAKIKKLINNEIMSSTTNDFLNEYVGNKETLSNIKSNQSYKFELNKNQLNDDKFTEWDLFNIVGELKRNDVFSSFTKTRKDYFELFLGDQNIEFSNFGEGTQLMYSLSATVNRYKNKESLILMDEPDAFIHPKNMVSLINKIKQLNHQTILTTHSPILLSNFKDAIGVVIGEKSFKDVKQFYGRKVEYLLEDVMDFDARPIDITRLIKDIDEKINMKQFEPARELLNDLKRKLGESDTDIISLETQMNIMEYMTND